MPKIITSIFLFLILCNQSFAQRNDGQNFLVKNKQDLTEIEKYINDIKFLHADFIQESSGKEFVKGKFWLSRPGKMRLEYGKPTPMLIVVNGNVLSYTDIELEETSYLSTNSTPASFLTRANFSFSAKDVEITNFSKNSDSMKVSIMKKNKKDAGEFTLIFKTNPIRFSEMEVKNDLDETTKVSLVSSKFGEKIDQNLFVVKNKNLPE